MDSDSHSQQNGKVSVFWYPLKQCPSCPKPSGNAITNAAHYMQNDHMEFLLLLFFKTA